jgi:hypothetical protein
MHLASFNSSPVTRHLSLSTSCRFVFIRGLSPKEKPLRTSGVITRATTVPSLSDVSVVMTARLSAAFFAWSELPLFRDNFKWLSERKEFPDESVGLVYLDPSFDRRRLPL